MSAPSTTDVKVDDSVFFHNGDKQKIVCKSWRAESEPRALVFLSHGYAEHCHEPSYDTLARALVGIGCYVFSHDHVGHGMSEGRRAMVKSADVYVDDILKHVDTERSRFANKPIYLVGHSMGGLLVLIAAQRRPHDFAGLVLVAPLLGVDKDLDSWFSTAVEQADQVELPFLIQHGTADKVCDPEASKAFFDKAASIDKTMKTYPEAYHDLLCEIEDVRKQVLKDIVDWIATRVSPKPAPPPPTPPTPFSPVQH